MVTVMGHSCPRACVSCPAPRVAFGSRASWGSAAGRVGPCVCKAVRMPGPSRAIESRPPSPAQACLRLRLLR